MNNRRGESRIAESGFAWGRTTGNRWKAVGDQGDPGRRKPEEV